MIVIMITLIYACFQSLSTSRLLSWTFIFLFFKCKIEILTQPNLNVYMCESPFQRFEPRPLHPPPPPPQSHKNLYIWSDYLDTRWNWTFFFKERKNPLNINNSIFINYVVEITTFIIIVIQYVSFCSKSCSGFNIIKGSNIEYLDL